MENSKVVWDPTPLISELTQGHQLTQQLESHQSCPPELKSMVQNILASWEKAMSVAKATIAHTDRQAADFYPPLATDSPQSASESPRSTVSEQDRLEMSKKRKVLPKWTNQVRIGTGVWLEGPVDDGYSWRKYGQKDILGAKHPRGYYRCTHRNTEGCLATKQVQRSDEDPSLFDITYRGKHTCHQIPHHIQTTSMAPADQEIPVEIKNSTLQHSKSDSQMLMTLNAGLTVKTENSGTLEVAPTSFSFPSTPIGSGKAENHIFSSSPSTLEKQLHSMRNYSLFVSPATSESNYFSASPCSMSNFGGSTQSELADIISAATSNTNTPLVDLDFPLQEFDVSFLDNGFFL